MVSFPKFPTAAATAPIRWAGCDANSVYHKQNRKTWATVGLLAAASFGYKRLLATPTLTQRAIVLGGAAVSIGWNNILIHRDGKAAVQASKILVAEEEKTEVDTDRIGELQTNAGKALDKVNNWSNWIKGLEKANHKNFTLEDLAATMRDQNQGVEAMVKWSLDKFTTPEKAAKKQSYWLTNTNTLLKDAMSIAMSSFDLARAEILLGNVRTNTSEVEQNFTVRTPREARAYVEGLDAAGRERLENALVGPYMVYSFARGLASQKPGTVEMEPGYAADWNSEENQNRFFEAKKGHTLDQLRTQYNKYAEASHFVSWIQAPQAADKTHPPIVKDEKESGFALAIFPTFLSSKESKIKELTKPAETEDEAL